MARGISVFSRLSMRDVTLLKTLVETGSPTLVADLLRVPKSSVLSRAHLLESYYGRLFDRLSGRGRWQPVPKMWVVAAEASDALKSLERASRIVKTLSGASIPARYAQMRVYYLDFTCAMQGNTMSYMIRQYEMSQEHFRQCASATERFLGGPIFNRPRSPRTPWVLNETGRVISSLLYNARDSFKQSETALSGNTPVIASGSTESDLGYQTT